MGAILEVFFSLVCAFVILIFTIGISLLLNILFKKGRIIIQSIIHFTCVVLIFYSSSFFCINRSGPQIPPKVVKIQKIEQIETTKMNIQSILAKIETFNPDREIIENDRKLIINTIKNFFNKSYNIIKSDSVFKVKYESLLESYVPINDSVEFNAYIKSIYSSIDVDLIHYSPDLKKIIVFISYNEIYKDNSDSIVCDGHAFALIGFKDYHNIKLYRFYYDSYGPLFCPNKEYAFYELILTLTNSDLRRFPINKKGFWDSKNIFSLQKINNQFLYGFQLDDGRNSYYQTSEYLWLNNVTLKIRKPLFTIDY